MPGDFENQISPKESEYQSLLQRDRTRQAKAATVPAEKMGEAGPNLNIVELILTLFLALGVDFGIGWFGGKLAVGAAAIPALGAAIVAVIMFLAKFATIGVAAILWLWCLLRLNKLPWKRLGGATFIEIIPFIGELVPGWTAFVVSVIIKEKILPMLQKYGAPAEKIAGAIPAPQAQAAAKIIKTARVAGEAAGKA